MLIKNKIGSNFVKFLLNEVNNEIVIYDNLSTGKLENIQKYIDDNTIKFENVDITEHRLLKK